MVAFVGSLLLVLVRASETVAGLLDRRDERTSRIDGDATSFAVGDRGSWRRCRSAASAGPGRRRRGLE
ncbi:hypothetical protein E1193_07500 [Micromonospora sp. KC606]|uniref:hypothetical protein n=1 Tax=Micromonospora sp. KC606 TaxID=2530379 RepID=UPI00104A1016|nr:hypothetical protein [Micromonospora sp. KC606]TDC83913.1 hypothetical protein E1193_07500 [Micromonospora sp. KC606]